MDHLELVAPISVNQWGALPFQLYSLAITNSCLQAFDVGYGVCTICFDIRKVFNSVPHRLLMEKK